MCRRRLPGRARRGPAARGPCGDALLLLAAPWLWGAILAAAGQPMGSQVCEKECGKFHPKIPLQLLRSYEKRECRRPVVFVTTKKNRTFCTNPKEPWVQDAMLRLDAKNAIPTVKVDTSVTEEPGEFHKLLGNTVRMSTRAGCTVSPAETVSAAAYGKSTPSVMRTEVPKPSAMNSMLTWAQTAKSSTGSISKTEVIVSGATIQPFANGSTASYFTDGSQSSGEGLAPVGKGLELTSGPAREMVEPPTFLDMNATETAEGGYRMESPTQSTLHPSSTIINLLKEDSQLNDRLLLSSVQQGSAIEHVTEKPTAGPSAVPQRKDFTSSAGVRASADGRKTSSVKDSSDVASTFRKASNASPQTNTDAFFKSSGTLLHSGFHKEHGIEKTGGEATVPSPEVPSAFVLVEYRSLVIAMVFLGFTLGVSLATVWMYAKHHICIRASPTEMAQGVKFSKYDSQTAAYAMQVL